MSSCDKADNLRAQQAELVQKRTLVQEKNQMVEREIRTLGPAGLASVAPIESQTNKLTAETTKLLDEASKTEAEASDIQRRWSAVDKLLGEFRHKVDEWKAKANP
jgi:chromosome segregation ATPase